MLPRTWHHCDDTLSPSPLLLGVYEHILSLFFTMGEAFFPWTTKHFQNEIHSQEVDAAGAETHDL